MIDPKFYTLFFILLSLIFLFREEIERQRTALRKRKLQEEGKTEEARADLARLAVIRRQREEAARKKEEQKKGIILPSISGVCGL